MPSSSEMPSITARSSTRHTVHDGAANANVRSLRVEVDVEAKARALGYALLLPLSTRVLGPVDLLT